jgi:DNA-binding MarR family transcriptional regulator
MVLIAIAEAPELTLRGIATRVGITERAVHRIVRDLSDADYISVRKQGRRNSYEVRGHSRLRREGTRHVQVSALLEIVLPRTPTERDSSRAESTRPAR